MRIMSARCPPGANSVLFQSNIRRLRASYTNLLVYILDLRMILRVASICGMNWSHKWMGHVGSIVHTVVIMWYFTALQLYLVAFTLWLYDSTKCRSVFSDVMYSFTAREHSLSDTYNVGWCHLRCKSLWQLLNATVIYVSSLLFIARNSIVFNL